MNLGKDWIACLEADGHQAVHWSSLGEANDDDEDIMLWAANNGHVVLTADLDFGTLLAASNAPWPSVIQLRLPNTPPSFAGKHIIETLRNSRTEIETGALVTIDSDRFRIRTLPINSSSTGSSHG